MRAGSSMSDDPASSAARSFVEPSESWISTYRTKVDARITSTSRKASGMRTVGRHGVDIRAATNLRHVAHRRCGRWRDGGELHREPAAFANLAFDADTAAVFF